MPRFAANLSLLFRELPLLERFSASRACGFRGVEILFPYHHPAPALRQALDDNGLTCVLINCPPGNFDAGERGFASLPGREQDFDASVALGLDYARQLNVPRLHVMAGVPPSGVPPEQARSTYVANLQRAVAAAAPHNIAITIEPINTRDMPGYFLNYQQQATELCAETGARLQMDLYHAQIMEGDLLTKLRRYRDLIEHIQIAGVPDRHEPDAGEVRYQTVFAALDELGYQGWVGCEYHPRAATRDGLGWLASYL